jgi:hypothetical protein
VRSGEAVPDRKKYLVLNLNFSRVVGTNLLASFNGYMNKSIKRFSEKYHDKHGLLKWPVEIVKEDYKESLCDLYEAVERSGREVLLIVDEVDSFANYSLIHSVTEESEVARAKEMEQFKTAVVGTNAVLREWGQFIKVSESRVCVPLAPVVFPSSYVWCSQAGADEGAIGRIFMTGLAPVATAEALSSLNMVQDKSRDPLFDGLCGFKEEHVRAGLEVALSSEAARQHEEQLSVDGHLAILMKWFNGIRTHPEQKDGLFNSQQCIHYFDQLYMYGEVPVGRMVDRNVYVSSDEVIKYILTMIREGKFDLFGSSQNPELVKHYVGPDLQIMRLIDGDEFSFRGDIACVGPNVPSCLWPSTWGTSPTAPLHPTRRSQPIAFPMT